MGTLKRIFAVVAFPLILGSLMLYSYREIPERGGIVIGTLAAISYMTIGALEWLFPHAESWKRYLRHDLLPDGLFLATNNLLSGFRDAAVQTTGLFVAAQFAGTIGFHLWPASWPLWGQWALALIVYEFGHYWAHRMAHEIDLLWRFHSLHHSSQRLYFLNAARFHPIDTAWLGLVSTVPLLALGAPRTVILLVAAVGVVHGVLQHANLQLRLGPLNWIFSTAELHRWHHSKTLEEANSNYGTNLILWDTAFGTRFLPEREPSADVGISEPVGYPRGYLGPLLAPFRWRRLHESSTHAPENTSTTAKSSVET